MAKAVGFVADAFEQVARLGETRQFDRLGGAGQEDAFFALGLAAPAHRALGAGFGEPHHRHVERRASSRASKAFSSCAGPRRSPPGRAGRLP
ncbi:MAG: hypothetical protein R3E96_16550 [Planctomycetota bacterium]